MSFAFYIYTTIIMGVALVTSAVALVVWLMTRRRDSLVVNCVPNLGRPK